MPPPIEKNRLLSTRKIILQVIFWLVGLALLAMVIRGAVDKGGGREMWERIRAAPPHLLAALVGCTLASALFNGTTFWLTIQPLRRVRWIDMNLLNAFSGMLNYAPVRIGAILRVAYHLRVDRLSIVQVGGWFALVTSVLFMGIGAVMLAVVVRDEIDFICLAIVLGQMIVGGFALRFVGSIPLLARHSRGVDQLIGSRRGVWGAIALRLLDLAAFTGRMAAAMAILGMHLPPSHIVTLATVALVANLMPVGNVGFREFFVSLAAARLSMNSGDADAVFKQLALLDRAGEALVFIPLGALAIPWYRARWKTAGAAQAPEIKRAPGDNPAP